MNQNMPCSSASADFLSPTSTIVRIRRKRTTDPLAGLMVSSKKLRTDNEAASTAQPASPDEEKSEALEAREIIYRLVGTSEKLTQTPFLDSREHKVVEMVDYNPEQNCLGRRQVSVLDHGYLEVMKAARAISDFGLDEKEKQEFEKACTAPLAQVESMMDGAVGEEMGELNKDYVYDFYWSNSTAISSSKTQQQKISSSDTLEVRLPTDEELQLFYGGENGDSDEQEDIDSQDSNAENNYRNDYPDEDEFNRSDQNENESTSDDDYDHYGVDI